jgi:hypothetical protein
MIASDSETPRFEAAKSDIAKSDMARSDMTRADMARSREPSDGSPTLDAASRERLGRYLQALYEPVLDEGLDPRLAELMRQLDHDRAEQEGASAPGRADH